MMVDIDFYSLFGEAIDSEAIRSLKSNFGECATKVVGKSRFDEYFTGGLCLCFEPSVNGELVLDCVFLYNTDKKYEQYKGKLPHGIDWSMNNAAVVDKFGEPDAKPPRGGIVPIFLDYKKLGVQIDFKDKSYENAENPMTSMCLYSPSTMPPTASTTTASNAKRASRCIVCANEDNLKFCSRCHLVQYCSETCQKKDWKRHKGECVPRNSSY